MLAWIAYAICALVWGSTYFAIAFGIESFTPFGLVSTRYLCAGALAFAISRLNKEALPARQDILHLIVQGILLLGIANALINWAESFVPSGFAAVICSTTPFFYAMMNREGVTLRSLLGLFIGFVGVAVLSWKPGQGLITSPIGLFALFLSTFLWAFGTLYGRKRVKSRAIFTNASVQMLAGGAFGLLITPFCGGMLHHPLTMKSGLALAYLMIFGSLIAYSAFGYLAKTWPPAKMSTYAFLNPIVAVSLGSLFRNEPFDFRVATGVAIILGGVAMVQIQPRRSK